MVDKKSATVQLAIDIEMKTCSTWTDAQRLEVTEMIRKYRFDQVSAVLYKVQKLVRDSGAVELSEKIFMGGV